jgi:hypothetical protein
MLGDPRLWSLVNVMRKCLRVTVDFIVKTVQIDAYPRFTFKSRESSVADSENTGYSEKKPQSAVQKQAQL